MSPRQETKCPNVMLMIFQQYASMQVQRAEAKHRKMDVGQSAISTWQFIHGIWDVVGPNFRFLENLVQILCPVTLHKFMPTCSVIRAAEPRFSWCRYMFITCWKLGELFATRQSMRGCRLLSYIRILGLVNHFLSTVMKIAGTEWWHQVGCPIILP